MRQEHRDFAGYLLGAAKNAELLVLAGEVGVVLDSHRSTIIAQGPYGVQAILEPAEPGQWARLLIVGARTGNARGESGYAGDQPGETERASGIGVEHEFVTDPCQFPASPGRTCLVVPVPEVPTAFEHLGSLDHDPRRSGPVARPPGRAAKREPVGPQRSLAGALASKPERT